LVETVGEGGSNQGEGGKRDREEEGSENSPVAILSTNEKKDVFTGKEHARRKPRTARKKKITGILTMGAVRKATHSGTGWGHFELKRRLKRKTREKVGAVTWREASRGGGNFG